MRDGERRFLLHLSAIADRRNGAVRHRGVRALVLIFNNTFTYSTGKA